MLPKIDVIQKNQLNTPLVLIPSLASLEYNQYSKAKKQKTGYSNNQNATSTLLHRGNKQVCLLDSIVSSHIETEHLHTDRNAYFSPKQYNTFNSPIMNSKPKKFEIKGSMYTNDKTARAAENIKILLSKENELQSVEPQEPYINLDHLKNRTSLKEKEVTPERVLSLPKLNTNQLNTFNNTN